MLNAAAQHRGVAVPKQCRRTYQWAWHEGHRLSRHQEIEDWPSFTLPVLKWMQSQGALSSYTHAGFGLDVQSTQLPNYITPPMDSIGANG